jgi:hypothetical protein
MAATMNGERLDDRPWYRQAWPWLVMIPPASAVIGCIITITLAITSSDGMVAADYYKRGLAINEQLARTERAEALGLAAEVATRGVGAGDEVRVRLRSAQPLPPEAVLKLRLVHPGRDGADREAMLARVAVHDDGRSVDLVGQWGEAAAVGSQVSWRLVLEGREWRLDADASMILAGPPLKIGAGS